MAGPTGNPWSNNIVSTKFRMDDEGLRDLERNMPVVGRAVATMMANEAKEYIMDHWSPISPSHGGSPPAVVTGDLEMSLEVSGEQLRDAGGRFSKKYKVSLTAWERYSGFLEEGTSKMEKRPFMLPAVVAISYNISEYARVAFRNSFRRWIS